MTATNRRPDEASLLRKLFNLKVRHADIKGERELELIRLAKTGDRRAKSTLDQAHLPLVYLTVRRYFGHGVDAEDLIQEGRLGLQHAVDKFDESFGVTFATYALRWVRHYAQNYLSQNCADIRVTPKIREAYGRMRRQGKTQADLAQSTDPADRRLLANIDAVVPAVSLDAPLMNRIEHQEGGELHDQIAAGGALPDEALAEARLSKYRADAVADVLRSLSPRELEVVLRRYPLDDEIEPQSQVEIGQSFASANGGRGGKLTRARIQQIEASALRRLAAKLQAADPEGLLRG